MNEVLVSRVAALVLRVVLVAIGWAVALADSVEILTPVAIAGINIIEHEAVSGVRVYGKWPRLRVVIRLTVALVIAILEGIAELQERCVCDRFAIGSTRAVVIRRGRRQVIAVGLIVCETSVTIERLRSPE